MRHVNQKARKVLDQLTEGLGYIGASKKIANNPAFMAVHVESVNTCPRSGEIFSVAHYYEQNGDLMRDPDVEFLRGFADGEYYPISLWQDGNPTIRHEAAEWDDAGQEIIRVKPRMQRDIAMFANKWLANIKEQQNLRVGKGRERIAR